MRKFKFLMAIVPGAILLFSMGEQNTAQEQAQHCVGGVSKSCILSPYGQSCVSTSTIKTCGGTIEIGIPGPGPLQ